MMNRRLFHKTVGLSALTATVPTFLQKTGSALAAGARSSDRVLVVIQLGGGNDGLNTVVPYADARYYRARPKIAIADRSVLRLDDTLGLHPEMLELHRLYQDGGLAIIMNVGYPNPNRSHFRSTDIWETASAADRILKTGWLGRYFDAACAGVPTDPLGLRIGDQPSLAFAGDRLRAATFANPKMLENPAEGPAGRAMQRLSAVEETGIAALDFVQRTGNQSAALSRELQRAAKQVRPKVDYPPFALCQSLRLVAQMIVAGLPPRVYYVTHGGFDTHAAQPQRHAYLLQEFSEAVALFHADLKAHGQLDRVLGITFSEFGRRVAENKNAGTDHGAASVLFAFGGKVKAGVHGKAPNLSDLDPLGDLVHQVDFRQVYAGVLKGWLGADPDRVLAGRFEPFPLIETGGKGS
jgi:uncharacterized protein (DUF1501 family)